MDFSHWISHCLSFIKIPPGVQTVSQITANRLRAHRRKLIGLCWLLLSVILGFWAEQIAQSEALQTWKDTHPPSPRVWRHALGSLGFEQCTDSKVLQKVLRNIPSMVDDHGSIWLSTETQWIAIYSNEEDSTFPVDIYGLNCALPKEGVRNWNNFNSGWDGFDQVLEHLTQALPHSPKMVEKKKSKLSRDSREIRY